MTESKSIFDGPGGLSTSKESIGFSGTIGSKDCYICLEPMVLTTFQSPCSCKGSNVLHFKCFEKLLDSGYEFCSICGDRYKNIDPPLVWKETKGTFGSKGFPDRTFGSKVQRPLENPLDSQEPSVLKVLRGTDVYVTAEVVIRKNGKKSVYKIDKLGRIQGECNVYYMGTSESKVLSLFTKSNYVNGKLEGKYIEYFKPRASPHPSGPGNPLDSLEDLEPQVLMESYFKNGVPNGLCRFYYRTTGSRDEVLRGQKTSSQGCYDTELRGALCEECFYIDGLMEGLCQSFYEPTEEFVLSGWSEALGTFGTVSPKLREKKFYKAGKLDGKFQEFDKLGRIITEGVYEADVKKGVWKSYTYF